MNNVFFTTALSHHFGVSVPTGSNRLYHPTKRARDKSVLGGSWIVVVAQRLVDTHTTRAASRIDPSLRIFKGLDASHRSERANFYDDQPR